MKLYYQDAHLTLYHGDCMDLLATLPDKAFDLAIVDPPYGIGMGKKQKWDNSPNTTYKVGEWDACAPSLKYFKELFKVSKEQIIWGGNYFNLPPVDKWLVWDKKQPEGIDQSMHELAWTSLKKVQSRIFRLFPSHVTQGSRIHQCQKPVALYKWLLANYAKPGQTILDTHLGSGSIAIACHYAGHHLTAIEKDEDYIKAALERYKRETAQMDMFAPAVEPLIYAQDPLDLPR